MNFFNLKISCVSPIYNIDNFFIASRSNVTKHHSSAVHQLTGLSDPTLNLLHRAWEGVTKDKEKKKSQTQGLKEGLTQMKVCVLLWAFLWQCSLTPCTRRKFYIARSWQITSVLVVSVDYDHISNTGHILGRTLMDSSNYTCIYTGVNISYFQALDHA